MREGEGIMEKQKEVEWGRKRESKWERKRQKEKKRETKRGREKNKSSILWFTLQMAIFHYFPQDTSKHFYWKLRRWDTNLYSFGITRTSFSHDATMLIPPSTKHLKILKTISAKGVIKADNKVRAQEGRLGQQTILSSFPSRILKYFYLSTLDIYSHFYFSSLFCNIFNTKMFVKAGPKLSSWLSS